MEEHMHVERTFIFILFIIVLHKGKCLYCDTIPRECCWLPTAVKWPWIKLCHSLGSFGWNWKGLTIIQFMCVKLTRNNSWFFFSISDLRVYLPSILYHLLNLNYILGRYMATKHSKTWDYFTLYIPFPVC